jgi:hypothetical protein
LINASLIWCGSSRDWFRLPRPLVMHANYRNYRANRGSNCRYAQYRGEKARLIVNGMPVTGMVRSVMEVKSSNHTRWIVSVVPKHGIAASPLGDRRSIPRQLAARCDPASARVYPDDDDR